ncbi:MAG: hypothetical protein M1817_004875 [Caeruleum heppii]|nr:MAG: hypothetical protein M1817_004875 [Caeruleum heppii]
MATVGLGVPVPKMLPITGTWALPFTAYYIILATRVVTERYQSDHWFGEKKKTTPNSSSAGPVNDRFHPDPLLLATRAQQNFAENVPWIFILSMVAELNGGGRQALNVLLGTVFILRVAHVELGLKAKGTMGHGRTAGYFGTQLAMLGLAGYASYLVKGFWGM